MTVPSSLLSRIARRAADIPTEAAVVAADGALDWASLWAWSGRLAVALEAQGVGPGSRVLLALPRSGAMVASLLAVWRLRAAYVPVDPALPAARLAWQAGDCGACAAIAETAPAWLPADVRVIDPRELEERPAPTASLAEAAETAYVIYTSGSSGRPKGVVVSHGALEAYLQSLAERLPQGIASAAYVSTPAADLGHTALFGALWHGWTLHIIEASTVADPDAFAEAMEARGIDLLKIVPSHLEALMQASSPVLVLPRRCLVLGGEAAPVRLAERVAALRPSCLLVNHYGPTETTVGVLTRSGAQSRSPALPLGRPLAHASARVLDADGNAVPRGVAGELCIGGASLADGYLHRPALTAERFVPDPAGGGRRLYRSGDKARQLPGGEFAFLGRLDDQVKIRGFRVEPEEVAARLRAVDGVDDAVVIARAAGTEEGVPLRLLGYATSRQPLDGAALRAALATELPDYMVPVAVQVLAALPLTANGKIDRAALPEPASEHVAPVDAHSRSLNDEERALLEIWQQVLRRDDLGVTDNFFDVGGDSILSLQIIAKARKAGLRITPKQIFEYPTIEAQAQVAAAVAMPAPALVVEVASAPDDAWYAQAGVGLDAVEAVYPATPLQQGLLFHGMREEQPGLYVNQLRLTLAGAQGAELDVDALRAAWQALVARHAVLRTRFCWPAGGEPLQIVERAAELPFDTHDGSADTTDAYAERYAGVRDARVAQGFAAERAPLMGVDLFARPDGAHDLLWTHHHALTDGWSTAQLLAELAALYLAAASGAAAPLPPPASYAEYVGWLRRQPSTEPFWRERLAALDEPARLAEALGPELRSGAAGCSEVLARELDASRHARLAEAAQRARVTLNTLVQGAWALLLARLAGCRQALFGVTVSGRSADWPQAQQTVGLFINSLPVWTGLDDDAGACAWLRALQARNAELREVEHTPLTDIQRWSGRSGETLFDSLLVFENYPLDEALREGHAAFDVRAVEADEHTHYPLTLIALPRASGLSLQWRWDGARLQAPTVARLAEHFDALLDTLAGADAQTRLGDIALAAEPVLERSQRFVFEPVTERIARRARQTPEAPALLFEDAEGAGEKTVSYGQLQAWAEQVAVACAGLDARGEAKIGIAMARSPALVAALLGTLRAGAAYVPLDPAYPDQRLRDMAADAGLATVLCDAAGRKRLTSLLPGLPLIEVSAAPPAAADGDIEPPATPTPHPEQLAYVIYTSGSTGRPKGVGVTHANLARLFEAAARDYDFHAGDTWALLHEYTFDFSVWEIFGALVYGARLLIVSRELTRDPPALHRALQRHGVSVLNQTPSAFAALSEVDGGPEHVPLTGLRYVIFGGEKLEPSTLASWLSRREAGGAPVPRLINMYGITETTVHVSFRALRREDVFQVAAPSVIGVPLADLSLHLLDARGRPLPVGAVGELHVGGAGLARGYLGRPGLTAERFVPDLYGPPGARLYRSGDLARRLADGGLDYVGRQDGQLKVRGFRIEAGEIEAMLCTHPEIHAAVAGSVDQRLVAWLLPKAGAAPAAVELRAFLADRLPAHMLPAAYVLLERLPVTAHGKLDRAALPPPGEALDAAPYVAPGDPVEAKLAAIWQDLLGVERVGVHDDFFLLGGHSLVAMQVLASLREAFGGALPLRAIFEKPVLADLAAELRSLAQATATATVGAAQASVEGSASQGIALSAAQQRLWFLWKLDPNSAAYHVSGAVELDGTLDPAALCSAYADLVARHPGLRLRFEEHGGTPCQHIEAADGRQIHVVDLEGAAERLGDTLKALVSEPFDLLDAPPLRCALVRAHARRHVLLLVMHHLIADDGSISLLCRDFAALYRARAQGGLPPPVALGDAAYAELLRERAAHLDDAGEAAQLAYWRERLGGEDVPLALPYDRSRRDGARGTGAHHRVRLPAALAQTLGRQAAARRATLFMNLLAAFQLLMYRYAGQQDIRVGVPLAGRDDPRLAEAVGFFVHTVVIRSLLRGGLRADQLLDAVREHLLAAHAHQNVPFARIVDALQASRDPGRTPLFQVLVNQRRSHPLDVELAPGLRASLREVAGGEAQFDLMLNIAEADAGALDLVFTYASDVFDAGTIERLAAHYLELLEQWSTAPRRPLASFALSDAAPSRRAPAVPVDALDVIERIVAQAAARGEAIAIDDGESPLSYRQLDAWSAAIATALRRRGAGAETRVGIAMARSAGLVAALLGVLRAGAAYVPLDPDYPAEHLGHVLDDAGIGLILTDAGSVARHAEHFDGRETLDVQALREAPSAALMPEISPHPQQVAYVIYTSGSTGRPKGVGVTRRNLARLFDAPASLHFDHRDTWTWFHSYAFDFSVWEIFGALVHGGRLVVVPAWTAREPAAFRRLLTEQRVSVLNQTPSAFAQLIQADQAAVRGGDEPLRDLRYVIFGGERLEPTLLADWSEEMATRGARPALVNMYGITETTVHVTERPLGLDELRTAGSVIGAPLCDLALRVLDADLNQVPLGVSGELCVGGAGLARGYLGKPGLTAERFVPDPHGPPGARLYRSGDLARRLADGDLEYMGRNDQQLKIRGFRIEPGEIQAALLTHPAVREAAVLARASEEGGRQLVAYLVAPGAAEDAGSWQEWLAGRLPAHMLPSAFVAMERFPLTPNGKLDRAVLPAPGKPVADRAAAPSTPLERTLLEIWQVVLRRTDIGVHDSFFTVGGDSILSLQVIAKAHEAGWSLSPRQVFEAPTVARLAALATAVGETDENGRLEVQTTNTLTELGLDPASVEDAYPATPLQVGMLYHALAQPERHAYLNQLRVHLNGPLDVATLRAAWQAAVDRHAVLRTRFDWQRGDGPWQIVQRRVELPFVVHDWREAGDADPARLDAWCEQDLACGFEANIAPLIRVAVFLCGEREAELVWTHHHLLLDGWSTASLLAEILRDYHARCAGQPLAIMPAPRYRDYVDWLRSHADEAQLEAWWRARFGAAEQRATLTASLPRPRGDEPGVHAWRHPLDATLGESLRRTARIHEITLNTLMQGAWALLLARYGHQQAVAYGTVLSGRPASLPQVGRMLGLFVNSLPVWVEAPAQAELGAWLSELQTGLTELRQYEHTPLARIQQWTGRSGDALFDSLLVFENYPIDEALDTTQGALQVSVVASVDPTHYPLALAIMPRESIDLEWAWDGARLDRDMVEQLDRHYIELLSQLATGEVQRVGSLTLSGGVLAVPAQRYPFRSLTQALSGQAQRTPEAIAVRCENACLSYAALEVWSNHLATQLLAAGVGAEQRVGLCVARGPALIAALLGILKSGAALVPLDPDYPAARLAQMGEDAGLVRVLADAASLARHGEVLAGCPGLIVDAPPAPAVPLPAVDVHPEQLAYVLYTSGSTGVPKGVAVSHAALWTHLEDFRRTYRIEARDTVLHSSTINFDVALHEILPALLAGATVEMRGPAPWTLDSLSERLVQRQVTFARIPTALWQAWQREAPARAALALRQVTVGGEALPGDALAQWQAGPLADIRLDNLYGPTETTIAALYRVTQADDGEAVTVPIGQPYPGRTARVLDAYGDAAPVGGLGELCIGGPTVARGYLGKAGQSAERFVPDPWGEPGARLYRSGDLCRQRADGAMDYLGREDGQVKLRGQRIELGEIEAVLRQGKGVQDAVVTVRSEGERRRLAGYVTGTVDTEALRGHLAARLPVYMVPATLTVLAVLPRMANGKLDRAVLPAPEEGGERVAPRDTKEAALLAIWSQVLGRDDLGVTDNFFEVGGDSILSLQIVARAREAGWRLTPRQVFEQPSVAQLAAVAQAMQEAEAEAVEERDDAPLPLTPIQRWFFERYPQGEWHWNQSVLLKTKHLELGALKTAAAALQARHDALRLRFERDAQGDWRQRVAPMEDAAPVPVSVQELASLEALAEAGQAVQASLDLTRGPVWRIGCFRVPDGWRVLVAIHHLAVDGVSWRVLLEELQTAYEQAERGGAVALPAPSTSWRTWARRLHDYAQRPERVAELAWWQIASGSPKPAPMFPTRPTSSADDALHSLSWRLSPERTADLLREAPRAYRMRVDEVLLAVLACALGRLMERGEVLVELEGHGREDVIEGVDLSRTIGWFTTQFPLRLPCVGQPSQALPRVRELLRSLPHRGLHWGLLAHGDDAASRTALGGLPGAEIGFNYLGRFDQVAAGAGRFSVANEPAGEAQTASRTAPDHALDIDGLIAEGCLSLHWSYYPCRIDDALAAELVALFDTAMAETLDHLATASPLADQPPTALPAIPADLKTDADRDEVVANWVARARLEVSLAPPLVLAALSIVPLNALDAPCRLFLLPPGHGMVGDYRSLARALNGVATVYALQSPWLRGRYWNGSCFEALAKDYVSRILAVQPYGPHALLGWSFGGRLAVAVADVLARRGSPAKFVGIVDTATHWDEGEPAQEDRALPAAARDALAGSLLGEALHADAVHARLMADHVLPRIDGDLHVWRALRNRSDPRRRMDWVRHAAGAVHDHPLDATHSSIVHHPRLLRDLRSLFGSEV